jgi:hypothetical protein
MHGLGSLGMSTTNDTRADCAQTQRTGGSSHGVTDDVVSVLGFWFKQSVSDVCNHIEYVWIEFRWRGTSEFEMSESVISLPLHSSTGSLPYNFGSSVLFASLSTALRDVPVRHHPAVFLIGWRTDSASVTHFFIPAHPIPRTQ